jgi:hypothetical protein
VVIWYIFPPFWYVVQRKIWQPWSCSVTRRLKLWKERILRKCHDQLVFTGFHCFTFQQ